MRKVLKFYLVASTIISSTIMGSMALAGAQEHLEDLDKRGLQIALKGVIDKFRFPTEEFNVNAPLDMERLEKVNLFLDTALYEKIENYRQRMHMLPGVRQNPNFKKLEDKQNNLYIKQGEVSSAWSSFFLQSGTPPISVDLGSSPEATSSSSNGQHSSWFQEHGIDGFDERTLKVAIQVILNKKNKYAIYSSLAPEDVERKEKVENLLKLLSQKKGSLYLEEKQRKISAKIQALEHTLHSLHLQFPNIEDRIKKVQAQREQETIELEQRRYALPKKIAAEEILRELKLLDDLFLTQIRDDHANSRRHDKGIIHPHASLDEAMGIYAESAMSITKVMKENRYVMDLIERVFNLFQGEGPVDFEAASKKISDKAKELNFPQIAAHFGGDHSYFPFFERLTSLFCQLVDDPTNLVYSQGLACKNGLYGRIVFSTLIALKEKLAEGINNPSQLPPAFSQAPHSAVLLEESMRQIQAEDDASYETYLKLCQKVEDEKRAIERGIAATREELEKLHGELISTRNPYENYWKDFLPRMGDSFRQYNRSPLLDAEILKVLFPHLSEGQIPDLETAKARFSALAEAGRPYAKLFTPPEE
ncbi:MAG: hypothetical protein K2X28_04700 [Alphaproteobacteria bacterium]|nr:hypothetical protein [Alphaproteobacteria bacterium]